MDTAGGAEATPTVNTFRGYGGHPRSVFHSGRSPEEVRRSYFVWLLFLCLDICLFRCRTSQWRVPTENGFCGGRVRESRSVAVSVGDPRREITKTRSRRATNVACGCAADTSHVWRRPRVADKKARPTGAPLSRSPAHRRGVRPKGAGKARRERQGPPSLTNAPQARGARGHRAVGAAAEGREPAAAEHLKRAAARNRQDPNKVGIERQRGQDRRTW